MLVGFTNISHSLLFETKTLGFIKLTVYCMLNQFWSKLRITKPFVKLGTGLSGMSAGSGNRMVWVWGPSENPGMASDACNSSAGRQRRAAPESFLASQSRLNVMLLVHCEILSKENKAQSNPESYLVCCCGLCRAHTYAHRPTQPCECITEHRTVKIRVGSWCIFSHEWRNK